MNIFPNAAVVAHAFIRKIPLLGLFMSRIGTIFVTPSKGKDSTRAIDKIIIHPPLRNAQAREMDDKELLETAANIIQSAYVA